MKARMSNVGPVRRRRRKTGRKPKMLLEPKDLDLMAQRRCLMILSVLSGEKTVEEVSREAQIPSGIYYQLEKKALSAMLASLVPGAGQAGSNAPMLTQMQNRIAELETHKRRLERLLSLTRMTLQPGPMTSGRHGPRKPRVPSAADGPKPSPSWRKSNAVKTGAKTSKTHPSTPTPAGTNGA